MDSHINLQNLRWPFHSRYFVPTVLGTPTSLSVQSTVLTSLRGNITQDIQGAEILRSHEIDLRYGYKEFIFKNKNHTKGSLKLITFICRYSSFTTVSSNSYNPFLNMQNSVNREQGFLIYLPINSDVKLNLQKPSLWFSFFRPSNLISGISLKSRIRTITRGRPLRTDDESYIESNVYEGDPNLVV